ncbi:MAG TPA: response regulator transcription factor [Candidatus Limnocylindrales bacterium]|nr:response regulator transcription factor [Candidatus Limnocylindrales bacterium]
MPSAAYELDPASDDPRGGSALRILVVDADDRTRESVAGILGIRHRFNVVGSAGHVAEAADLAEAHRPQVVILDPRLPEVSDGMALIRRLRQLDARVAILAVGWSPDLEHQALAAGADGFVRKTFKPGDLSSAIARCMDHRLADEVDRIEAARADIALVKGEPGLTLVDPGPGAGLPAGSDASPDPAAERSGTPVPERGAGLIL